MGSTGCSRRVRAAAGLGEPFDRYYDSPGRGESPARASCSSRSASGSGSGTSSDEELDDVLRSCGRRSSTQSTPSDRSSDSGLSPSFGAYHSNPLGSSTRPLGSSTRSTVVVMPSYFAGSCGGAGTPDSLDLRPPGTTDGLSRQPSQAEQIMKELIRVDSRLMLTADEQQRDDMHLSPDVPLIYVSCISILVLLFYVLFMDGKALTRMVFPIAVDEFHWHSLQKLEMGLDVGASILLAFFVWLLHALLFDVAGMISGLLPSAVTFSAVFSHRILHQSAGYLVAALIAVACGFAVARSLETQLRVRLKLDKMQSGYCR